MTVVVVVVGMRNGANACDDRKHVAKTMSRARNFDMITVESAKCFRPGVSISTSVLVS